MPYSNMKQTSFFVIAFASLCLLTGCATPYQSEGLTGGFGEKQLGSDVFEINFGGNAYTSDEKMRDFAILHATDICLQKGFTCFTVLSESNLSHFPEGNHLWLKIQTYAAKPQDVSTYDATSTRESLRQKYHLSSP